MTAIVGFAGRPRAEREHHCRNMLERLSLLGGPVTMRSNLGEVTFAGSSDAIASSSPMAQADDRHILAGDIWLSNRCDLVRALGSDLAAADDSALVLASWLRWGDRCFDHLAGDYAFALWDQQSRTLLLARDPTGQRPLFYTQSAGTTGFASMAAALLEVPEWRRGVNRRTVEAMLRREVNLTDDSYFSGIFRVRPGCAVIITDGHVRHRRHWWPPQDELPLSRDDLADAYLSGLKDAVASRVPQSGEVGVHLSSGWDSSAVAATLASIARSPRPIAFTSAPREGFDGPVPRDRFADESALAAMTAAKLNLRHQTIRSGPALLACARTQARLYEEPFCDVANMSWSRSIYAESKALGVSTILTGEMGNLSFNAGGLPALSEFIRQNRLVAWGREIAAAARSGKASWKGAFYNSFRPQMPPWLQHRLEIVFLRSPKMSEVGFGRESGLRAKAAPSGIRYHGRYADRFDLMSNYDVGKYRAGALAEFGIRECDPTADRRLLDFSYRLPPESLLHDGEWRPLARRALGRLLPREIIDNPLRGYQAADWHERLDRQSARDLLEEVRVSTEANDLIDFDKVERSIDRWPTTGWADPAIISEYRVNLPIALLTGVFIQEFGAGSALPSS